MPVSQRLFLNSLTGEVRQKSFRVVDPRGSGEQDVKEIVLSLAKDEEGGGAYTVDFRFSEAPDIELFLQEYSDEASAKKVWDDFVMLAAEVEGLIKSEKFEEAREATKNLFDKFKANSNQSTPLDLEHKPKV